MDCVVVKPQKVISILNNLRGYRAPQDSYDAFVVLNEEKILPDDFLSILRQMVSFRNRVVHLYWDVDDQAMQRIVQVYCRSRVKPSIIFAAAATSHTTGR